MPLLFPPRSRRGERIKTICLDPGHGGKDPGNQEQRRLEKKFTLLLAQEVQRLLKEANFKVVLTRAEDAYLSLFERTELARKRGADLFLSLHFNAAQGNDVKGIETYCLTPAHASSTNARGEGAETGPRPGNKLDDRNLLLAYHLQRTMVKGVKAEDRGVRRARFFVLKTAEMPAALIEGGFMTDPEEGRKIADPAYSRQLARAIVDGLLAYKKIVERP
jgi:N-acetylmuramoyl-L-alanine amidase